MDHMPNMSTELRLLHPQRAHFRCKNTRCLDFVGQAGHLEVCFGPHSFGALRNLSTGSAHAAITHVSLLLAKGK